MNQYAPIVIPTLNRYDHLKRCVESLAKCNLADKTDLFISLDYPPNDSYIVGYAKIKQYLPTIIGFRSVNIIFRETNYGSVKNYILSIDYVYQKYDRLIFSEDDNEFSPNFLEYMNEGLEIYSSDSNIFAICGYNYPIILPKNYHNNIYVWKGFSAWGYGCWRNKWERINTSPSEIMEFLQSKKNLKKLNSYASHYYKGLINIIHTKIIAYDTLISLYLIKNNKYCIFPTISKVRNHGHDGSGTNSGKIRKNIYVKQDIDKDFNFIYKKTILEENPLINKILRDHFSITIKGRCLNFFKIKVINGKIKWDYKLFKTSLRNGILYYCKKA